MTVLRRCGRASAGYLQAPLGQRGHRRCDQAFQLLGTGAVPRLDGHPLEDTQIEPAQAVDIRRWRAVRRWPLPVSSRDRNMSSISSRTFLNRLDDWSRPFVADRPQRRHAACRGCPGLRQALSRRKQKFLDAGASGRAFREFVPNRRAVGLDVMLDALRDRAPPCCRRPRRGSASGRPSRRTDRSSTSPRSPCAKTRTWRPPAPRRDRIPWVAR